MQAFRAKYVLPIDGPPLRDGVVAIDGDRIVAVGEAKSAALADYLPHARDFGDAILLPGLVNPHTHLEFSDLRLPLGHAAMSFPEWIYKVIAYKADRNPRFQKPKEEVQTGKNFWLDVPSNSVAGGVDESKRSGVTTLGDIESGLRTLRTKLVNLFCNQYEKQSLDATSFLEVIALRADRVDEASELLTAALDYVTKQSTGRLELGVSPHAPYTAHPALIEGCVDISIERELPLAHHLAESREEMSLLRTGTGQFVKLLQDLDAWDPTAIPFGSRPLDYLKLLSTAHRALVIHGNYLDDEEIEYVAAHANNMSVVYCPRTHAYFDHDPYPLAKMIAAGVPVALGTDSRASNPDLAPLGELRFAARQHPLIGPQRLVSMITRDAAVALGREAEIGSLLPGKFADLCVLSLPKHHHRDIHEALLDANARVMATIFRGEMVFEDAAER